MSNEEIRSDMRYQVSLSIAKTMLCKGIITADEYAEVDAMLIEKYKPYIGKLMSKNA